ncbi:hypothetical protein CJ030_MR1G003753 [Morella rubra]|uniref:Uncharacterized protein n=1 Tax=Morella rubra TaxID=262757 RepID=A0A6A1WU53_9ROSI|nr:hypothetical protein CJ030_MR1G003753 [Morella rubra]
MSNIGPSSNSSARARKVTERNAEHWSRSRITQDLVFVSLLSERCHTPEQPWERYASSRLLCSLGFSKAMNPPPRTRKDSHSLSLGGGTRRDSHNLPLGSCSSKRRPSHEAKASSSCSGYKRRRMPSPAPSDREEDEADDGILLACRPSRHGANNDDSKEMPPVRSLNAGVRTEVVDLEMRDIPEVGGVPLVRQTGVEVPTTRQPSALEASIVGDSGMQETAPTGEPSMPVASTAGSSGLSLAPLAKGKGILVPPAGELDLESSEDLDSPPSRGSTYSIPIGVNRVYNGFFTIYLVACRLWVLWTSPSLHKMRNMSSSFNDTRALGRAKCLEKGDVRDADSSLYLLFSGRATSGIKQVRGKKHEIALKKARISGKLSVHIPEGRMGGDDKASSMLFSHIGLLVRLHIPLDAVKWSKVSNEVKSYVMNKVLDDFNVNYDRPENQKIVMSTMNIAYRTHRNKMHQYYSLFPTKEEALEHLYPNMKKEDWAPIWELFSTEEFQLKCLI